MLTHCELCQHQVPQLLWHTPCILTMPAAPFHPALHLCPPCSCHLHQEHPSEMPSYPAQPQRGEAPSPGHPGTLWPRG